jgi:hypothetical protein
MTANSINAKDEFRLLKFKLSHTGKVVITVSGTSMLPVLCEGDKVGIVSSLEYDNGDILSFLYDENKVIVHRLLLHRKDRFFLKGDNSFRMEEVNYNNILGKVVEIERDGYVFKPTPIDLKFISDSLDVHSEFVKCGFDHKKVLQTSKYMDFEKNYIC